MAILVHDMMEGEHSSHGIVQAGSNPAAVKAYAVGDLDSDKGFALKVSSGFVAAA